jgi:hypothetical protein
VPFGACASTGVSKAPKGCCAFGTPTSWCPLRTVHLTPYFPEGGRKSHKACRTGPTLSSVGRVLEANELIERPAGRKHREHESDPSDNQNQHVERFEFGRHNDRRLKASAGVPRRSALFPSLLWPARLSCLADWLGRIFGNHLRSAGLSAFKQPSLTRSPRQPCSNLIVRALSRSLRWCRGWCSNGRETSPTPACTRNHALPGNNPAPLPKGWVGCA